MLSEGMTYILFIGKHIDFPHYQTSMVLFNSCNLSGAFSVFFSYAFNLLMKFNFDKPTVKISC